MRSGNSWTDLKHRLIDTGALDQVFAANQLIAWQDIDANRHNPLLLSQNISRASELIEDCLAIRKEVRELEILAIKAEEDYELFLKTAEISQELEKLKLLIGAKELEQNGQQRASETFGTDSSLERGLAELSRGKANALTPELKSLKEQLVLVEKYWEAEKQYQNEYKQRTTEPGNAHNYGERAQNLMKIFAMEMTEAVERAIAIKIGLEIVYHWSADPLPSNIDLAALDAFVLWMLNIRQKVSFLSENENPFEIIVPLTQPWLTDGLSLISLQEFLEKIRASDGQPAVLEFNIDPRTFLGNENVRLSAFGLAFGHNFDLNQSSGVDQARSSDEYVRLAAVVTPPSEMTPEGTEISRPPIVLGNISTHSPGQAAASTDGVSVINLNPLGRWRIQLHPWVVYKDNTKHSLAEVPSGPNKSPIMDLKLIFRAYIPSAV